MGGKLVWSDWLFGALLLLSPACRSSQAATGRPSPPSDQVWLTADEATASSVEVMPVQEHDIDDTMLTGGRVTFDDRRVGRVFSPVTGRVVSITAQLGQHVKKGAPLATIESPDVSEALSDVQKAEADLIAAEHDYERQKALHEEQAASTATLERSEDAWRKARAEVDRARQKASLLHSGRVDSVTQSYILVSPIEGEVLARSINPGIEVQGQYGGGTAQELFTIGDLERVWVVGDLYESDLARVHAGSPVAITVLAHKDRVFMGAVDWVSGTFDSDTRTAKVRCVIDNADRALSPEMYATLKVTADPTRALAMPRTALLKLGEYPVVFVREGEGRTDAPFRFTRIPVDVDEAGSGSWLSVRHGVDAGQEVVVQGGTALLQRL